ncbi:MAG: 2-amino-4-hydroxy-6-hydroxymethyldihydropteridine diphosphokinase, partial [Chitinophagia bacterium]|nr:2-amino-4-hydroxy-6-hydroxymethyldihydropteridine diphosphokinase [Chitinophagia bacterium]
MPFKKYLKVHQRDIYLSLGSNMGEREATLHEALRLLKEAFPVGFIVSPFYSTAPWGNTNQDSFINCCCKLQSDIPITDLLTICQNIEHSMGRARTIPWGARTLDIDIVLAGDEVVQTEQLTIPHRYMAERRFVLVPLADIA